jgi:pimeloyl-ACP methyl ester carboxylesterase
MVAQHIAYEHPGSVRCLFSVMSSSGAPNLPLAAPEVRARLQVQGHDRESAVALETENRAIFGSPGYPESESQRRRMSKLVYDRCHCPAGVARQMRAAIDDGSRTDRLAAIDAPTLVIHGADDPLLPAECGEDTARHIPGARFLPVAGMGHNIPDALAGEIAGHTLVFIDDSFIRDNSG